jgi:dsDNA-binding SOS-regulon protein
MLDAGRLQAPAAALIGKASALVQDIETTISGPSSGYSMWLGNWGGLRHKTHSTWSHKEAGKLEKLQHALRMYEAKYNSIFNNPNDTPWNEVDWRGSQGQTLLNNLEKSRYPLEEAYEEALAVFRAMTREIAKNKALEAERVQREKAAAAAKAKAAKDAAERKALGDKWKATRGRTWEDQLPGRDLAGNQLPEPSPPPSWGQWATSKFGF